MRADLRRASRSSVSARLPISSGAALAPARFYDEEPSAKAQLQLAPYYAPPVRRTCATRAHIAAGKRRSPADAACSRGCQCRANAAARQTRGRTRSAPPGSPSQTPRTRRTPPRSPGRPDGPPAGTRRTRGHSRSRTLTGLGPSAVAADGRRRRWRWRRRSQGAGRSQDASRQGVDCRQPRKRRLHDQRRGDGRDGHCRRDDDDLRQTHLRRCRRGGRTADPGLSARSRRDADDDTRHNAHDRRGRLL